MFSLPQEDRTEAQIVQDFIAAYSIERFYFDQDYDPVLLETEFFQEVTIPHIGRRSDVIMKVKKNTLINIEFKLTNWRSVFSQAYDHLKWADYSYICMPDYAMNFTPTEFHTKIIEHKIGLLLYANNAFTHAVKAYHNSYKERKDKKIRKALESILKTKKII